MSRHVSPQKMTSAVPTETPSTAAGNSALSSPSMQALIQQANRLPKDTAARTQWLLQRCVMLLDPVVVMMAGEIEGDKIRESFTENLLPRTTVVQLKQELWTGLKQFLDNGPDTRVQMRDVDGAKYSLLNVPLISTFDLTHFGMICVAAECSNKATVQRHLQHLKELAKASFGVWDAGAEKASAIPNVQSTTVDQKPTPPPQTTVPANSPVKAQDSDRTSVSKPSPKPVKSSVGSPESNNTKVDSSVDSPATEDKRELPVGQKERRENASARPRRRSSDPPERRAARHKPRARTRSRRNADAQGAAHRGRGASRRKANGSTETRARNERANDKQALTKPRRRAERESAAPAKPEGKESVRPRPTRLPANSDVAAAQKPQPEQKTTSQPPVENAQNEDVLVLNKASQFETHTELAYELANSIANKYECEQVGVGIASRGRIRVVALSGVANVKPNSPGTLQARQAMEECLDQNAIVSFPVVGDDASQTAHGVHQMWSKGTSESCVYSLPLQDKSGNCIAVVSLRRSHGHPLDSDALVQLKEVVKAFGPGIQLLMKASRSLKSHVGDVIVDSHVNLRSNQSKVVGLLAIICFCLWCYFGQIYYRPTCNAIVTSGSIRHVTAPMDGRLKEVFVKEGQPFEVGDPLLQFATEKLELQKNLLIAELGEVAVDFKLAISDKEPKAIALKRAKMDVIRAKIKGAELKLKQATIHAEQAGSVSHHDLHKSVGQEFRLGDPMMELAIGSVWDVEIEVPDRIATYIAPGQKGYFSPAGRPMDVIPFTIQSVSGLAEVRDGKNVFVARARMKEPRDWMRGGMKGTTRITTDKRPAYWVLFRDAIDWLHATLWF